MPQIAEEGGKGKIDLQSSLARYLSGPPFMAGWGIHNDDFIILSEAKFVFRSLCEGIQSPNFRPLFQWFSRFRIFIRCFFVGLIKVEVFSGEEKKRQRV